MDGTIKIVAAILDTERLTLYRESGQTIQMNQGDPRIKRILDDVTEPLTTEGCALINMGNYDTGTNNYREFEEKTSGIVKFFRVAKQAVASFFSDHRADNMNPSEPAAPVEPIRLGQLPGTPQPMGQAAKPSIQEATNEIMAQAQPVSDPGFSTADTRDDHTMIAEVTDPASGKKVIIPGMEHLSAQIAHAAKLGSAVGVQAFIQRIAAVINDRGHTIDELLRFMSKGDLPIADDGSIVAYKVLQTTSSTDKDEFVDCHSKQVKQRVGSMVHQKYVDPSRRTECSQGLHIARRGYLGGFSGDIIVLVKVAPEDVIAVPTGEPNKMRARAYHILSEIPKDEHHQLRRNEPIEGMKAKQLLGQALRGEHIGVIEDVYIGGPKGSGLEVIQRVGHQAPARASQPRVTTKTAPAEPVNPEVLTEKAPVVPAKAVSEQVTAAKAAPKPAPKPVTNKPTKASSMTPQRELFEKGKFAELVALRKAKKKSWAAWGFSQAEERKILAGNAGMASSAPKPTKAPVAKAAPKKAPAKPKPVEKLEPKKANLTADFIDRNLAHCENRKAKAVYLLNIINSAAAFTPESQRIAYQKLIDLKRTSKVGWMQLGVDNFDAIQAKFERT